MVVLFENMENGEGLKILKTEDKDSVNKRSVYEYTYVCAYRRLGVRGNACCLMDYATKRKVLWVEFCLPKIQMWKPELPVLQIVTLFGHIVLKEESS